jgi:hypothetical protein
VGTAFSGLFRYDNAATFSTGGTNFSDFVSSLGAISTEVLTFSAGGTPPLFLGTRHDVGFNGPGVPNANYDFLDVMSPNVELVFLDADRAVFASTLSLPSSLPLASFEYIAFTAFLGPTGQLVVGGLVDNISEVPEPSPLPLIVAGLAVLTVQRFRRCI